MPTLNTQNNVLHLMLIPDLQNFCTAFYLCKLPSLHTILKLFRFARQVIIMYY